MKSLAVVILIVLTLGVIAPSSFAPLRDRDACASLCSLDVCHSAAPADAPGGGMPCLAARAFEHSPTHVIAYQIASKPLFAAFLMTGCNERPPAA